MEVKGTGYVPLEVRYICYLSFHYQKRPKKDRSSDLHITEARKFKLLLLFALFLVLPKSGISISHLVLGVRGTFPVFGFWKKKAGHPIFAGIQYILLHAQTYRGHFNLRADAPWRACLFVCLFVNSIYCIANYRSKCLGPDASSASPRYEGHFSLKNTLFSQLGSPSLALLPDRKRPVRTFGASQGQLLRVVCRIWAAWVNRSFKSRSVA